MRTGSDSIISKSPRKTNSISPQRSLALLRNLFLHLNNRFPLILKHNNVMNDNNHLLLPSQRRFDSKRNKLTSLFNQLRQLRSQCGTARHGYIPHHLFRLQIRRLNHSLKHLRRSYQAI
jgi:hypothetical protein